MVCNDNLILTRASATEAKTIYRDAAVSLLYRKTPVDHAFCPLVRGPLRQFHGDSISPKGLDTKWKGTIVGKRRSL